MDDQSIEKAVLVFIDGHKSNANGIILYALPANATHLIQPADVGVFNPSKSEWKNTVDEWTTQPENVKNVLMKSTSGPLLKKVLEKENLPVKISKSERNGIFKIIMRHQNNATDNAKSPGTKIKNRKLNTAIKIINQLSNDLENVEIDVKTVVN